MHALIARIHPSLRRALVAWVIIRGFLWAALLYQGAPLPHETFSLPWASGLDIEHGAPLWVALQHGAQFASSLDAAPNHLGFWLLVGGSELTWLIGAIAVYRFVRTEHLPHTADRATWFWLILPATALTIPISAWTFAAGLTAAGLACVARSRLLVGGFLLAVATGFRPETLLVWPGAVWLGLKKQSADQPLSDPGCWGLGLLPPAAFTGSIASALLLAGDWGVSLRSIQPHARWRSDLPWWQLTTDTGLFQTQSFYDIFPAAAAIIGITALLVLLLFQANKLPFSWHLITLPPLAWPLAHQPPTAAAASCLLALPAAALLGRITDNRVIERTLLTACTAALLLAATAPPGP